jgi:putative transposase
MSGVGHPWRSRSKRILRQNVRPGNASLGSQRNSRYSSRCPRIDAPRRKPSIGSSGTTSPGTCATVADATSGQHPLQPSEPVRGLPPEQAALRQRPGRPQLSSLDRLLWVLVYRIWPQVIDAMVLVKPAAVIAWHRKGFRFYWRWRSRCPGRPRINPEIRNLIRRMSNANPLWGAPRIHGELLKLGIKISQATVGRWMPWRPKVPSPTWRSFLSNHLPDIAAIDMFVVATATFQLLYALIVLSLDRRRVVHFEVTPNPTQDWLSRQMTEAFPWDTAPRYLLRDRDKSYGPTFRHRARAMGITEVVTAPRSPWQNPYAERLIGSIRRECLDHVIIFSERHLRRVLSSYFQYHHDSRTHLSLGKECPRPRPIQFPSAGKIIAFPEVGGLHHRYERRAA